MNRPLATVVVGLILVAAPAGSVHDGGSAETRLAETSSRGSVERPAVPVGASGSTLNDPILDGRASGNPAVNDPTPGAADEPSVVAPRPAPAPLTLPPPAGALDATALVREVPRRAAQIEAAGETLAVQQAELTAIREELAVHTTQLATLDQELAERQRVTDQVARTAYMSARHSPESLTQTPALLSVFPTSGEALSQAREQVAEAQLRYQSGAEVEGVYAATVTGHEAQFQAALAELTALRTQHAAAIELEQKALDVQRRRAGAQLLPGFGGANSKGMVPGPAAVKAVEYALAQLGKPYVFGAEGPDTFDCSGLVQAAYGQAGVRLPRTARPQWRATTPVSTSDLLAGDLIFFGTDRSNWDSIYHVGIYIGGGEMAHAPMPGDVLKIAPIWWEDFFGATRVVPAVPGKAKPPAPPRPAPAPSPATPVPPASPVPPVTPPKIPPATTPSSPVPSPVTPPVDPPTPETAPSPVAPGSVTPETTPSGGGDTPVEPDVSGTPVAPLAPGWRGRVANVGNVR